MDITSVGAKLLDGITQHFPNNQLWVPWVGVSIMLVLGLVLLVKGARLAPKLLALSFLLVGGVAGSHVAQRFQLPFWPIVASAGVVGAVLGFVMFRFLLALFLAGCGVVGSLAAYGVNVLNKPLSNYAPGYNGDQLIELPSADASASTPWTELGNIWSYLSAHPDVSNFQQSFWAIVLSTGLAGLMVGLLLPKASRALWAATAGVLFVGLGSFVFFDRLDSQIMDPLLQNPKLAWGIVGGVWLVSFVLNFRDMRDRRPRITVEDDAIGRPATA